MTTKKKPTATVKAKKPAKPAKGGHYTPAGASTTLPPSFYRPLPKGKNGTPDD